MTVNRIGLVGTFDVENFGDCFFPEVYATLLGRHLPDAEISLYSPTATPAEILSFDAVKALPARFSEVGQIDEDALILVGGETLGFGHSSGTYNYPRSVLSSYLRLWLGPLYWAATDPANRRFIVHCVGAKKMPVEVNKLIAKALSAAKSCTFRDRFSQSWISDGDIKFGQETDPMFLLDSVLTPDEWHDRAAKHVPAQMISQGYIAAQMSPGYGGDALLEWAGVVGKVAKSRGQGVVLLPICHFLEDEYFLERAKEQLLQDGIEVHLVRGRINVKDTAAVISASAGYFGTSLHGAVSAVAFEKPLAIMGHSMDGKHEGTLRSVGATGCVTTRIDGLEACFETSLGHDQAALRKQGHANATKSLEVVLQALAQPADRVENTSAISAMKEIAEYERRAPAAGASSELKRWILRQMRRSPKLSEMYHQFRTRKRINGASSGQG